MNWLWLKGRKVDFVSGGAQNVPGISQMEESYNWRPRRGREGIQDSMHLVGVQSCSHYSFNPSEFFFLAPPAEETEYIA